MKNIKRTLAIIMAIAMCFSMSTFAFATEPSDSEEPSAIYGNVIGEATYLVSDGDMTLVDSSGDTAGIMPLSSIGGYNQKTITGGKGSILIDCNGQGWGGMGITIRTSCSYGDYPLIFEGLATIGSGSYIQGVISTNGEKFFSDLGQNNLDVYAITFQGTQSYTPDFLVRVWIYG